VNYLSDAPGNAQQPHDTPMSKVAVSGLGAPISQLGRGQHLTLVGVGAADIIAALRPTTSVQGRGALLLDTSGRTSSAVLHRLLDDLADLALDRWPQWYGRDEAAENRTVHHAPADQLISAPWARAAARRAEAGRRPRFRRAAEAFEFVQLMRVVDIAGPILIAAVDPASPDRAAPIIQVLEWCVARSASVVVIFSARPPFVAPYDRVLYGALEVIHEIKPAGARFIAPSVRSHHASVVEQRVEAALQRDTELGPLFSCNEAVPIDGFGPSPRVDLLWSEGRIVVELDGPDHQLDPKFANDRHRDYELLIGNYILDSHASRHDDFGKQGAVIR
jgi:hypothetical protein